MTDGTDLAGLVPRAVRLVAALRAAGASLATAESCTGGLIAALITDVPGSSDVFDRGFVTYSNAAKNELLGVPAPMIAAEGAVSEAVARAMAEGALAHARASLAVAVTGIAGPGGGSAGKPVGLVHLALAQRDGPTSHRMMHYGDLGRAGVRRETVATALEMIEACLQPRP